MLVIKRLQRRRRMKQRGVEIRISQPFARKTCKPNMDYIHVLQCPYDTLLQHLHR